MDKFNRMSVATVKAPEFINIQSISPLISKCEIKVLYVGKNRNGSFISHSVAEQMAQTLPGSPIVGYFIESKEDFGDHGDQLIIDGEGVHFTKLTKPYGFVAPDAKVWFQEYEDTDEFGNVEIREYLVTEGYLWTEQYEECKRAVTQGNPQSMELDEKSLKGYWSEDSKTGCEFFIINDAVFSKLCILGEDVEPCFEGAAVSAPKMDYSLDSEFTDTLFNMMTELKFALQKGGELSMDMENQIDNEIVEEFSQTEDNSEETPIVENQDTIVEEEFVKKKSDEDEKEEDEAAPEEEDKEEDKADEEDEDEKKKSQTKHSLHTDEEYDSLSVEYSSLQEKYSALETEVNELREFKLSVENEKKDALINSFYMLSDEDKANVIANKAQYSLEDIKKELCVICVDKKVNFNLEKESEDTDEVPTTFNLHAHEEDTLPAWLKAVEDVRKRNN